MMSYVRSISFGENELDLMDYFDRNGRSLIAKNALRYYRDNRDSVITAEVKNEILKIVVDVIGSTYSIGENRVSKDTAMSVIENEISDKMGRLLK